MSKLKIPMWLILVFAVGLFGFVYFFTKPNNSTRNIEKYIDEYIDNSVEIEINDINLDDCHDTQFDDLYIGLNFDKLNRSKLSSVPNNYFTVYDSNRNKYFRVLFVSSAESMQIYMNNIENTLVKARVYQSQLNDSNYGTRENPVPVLFLDIPKYKKSPHYWMIEKTQEEYRELFYTNTKMTSRRESEIIQWRKWSNYDTTPTNIAE